MVSSKSVQDQLKKIHFNSGWNRPETDELAQILLPDEEIFECVSGWYEGGYSLLCATNIRVLLIDKKPFKFLTVEDLRFDMITQIDYSHRMFNASIGVSAGSKNLTFRSYNQPRLRKLISHVQNRMAELKKLQHEGNVLSKQDEDQAQMDLQLRAYLLGQRDSNNSQLTNAVTVNTNTQPTERIKNEGIPVANFARHIATTDQDPMTDSTGASATQLYEDGIKEIFGKYQATPSDDTNQSSQTTPAISTSQLSLVDYNGLHVNPLKIAYSKLPLILSIKRHRLSSSSI